MLEEDLARQLEVCLEYLKEFGDEDKQYYAKSEKVLDEYEAEKESRVHNKQDEYTSYITLCETCEGTGNIYRTEVTSFKGDRARYKHMCEDCDGYGRLLRKIKIRHYKFEPDEREDGITDVY